LVQQVSGQTALGGIWIPRCFSGFLDDGFCHVSNVFLMNFFSITWFCGVVVVVVDGKVLLCTCEPF